MYKIMRYRLAEPLIDNCDENGWPKPRLANLNNDMIGLVSNYLGPKDLVNLSMISAYFYTTF